MAYTKRLRMAQYNPVNDNTQWNEVVPRIAQYTALLGEVASELRRIAQVFRETDQHVI